MQAWSSSPLSAVCSPQSAGIVSSWDMEGKGRKALRGIRRRSTINGSDGSSPRLSLLLWQEQTEEVMDCTVHARYAHAAQIRRSTIFL